MLKLEDTEQNIKVNIIGWLVVEVTFSKILRLCLVRFKFS